MKTNTNVRSSTHSRPGSRLFAAAGVTWFLLAAMVGRVLAASAPTPPEAADGTAAAWSAQGQQLLAATVALLAAMVLMERLCAWRLRARRRQASAGLSLRVALPSNPVVLPARWVGDLP